MRKPVLVTRVLHPCGGALGQITAELALNEPPRKVNSARNAATGYQITVVDHPVRHR